MDEGNLPILVDAKTEYTKQLIKILSPDIYFGIKNLRNAGIASDLEHQQHCHARGFHK